MELKSSSRTVKNKWKWVSASVIALAALVTITFYGYRYYGPTPWRTLRLFVKAFNAGDFDAQYALFVDNELGDKPLLPKEDFRALLKAMDPPFPRGIRISMIPTTMHPHHRKYSGITVRVLDRGDGPPPAGGPAGAVLGIATQRTKDGWGVRGHYTYSAYYRSIYGDEAGRHFDYLYLRTAYRRGLLRSGSAGVRRESEDHSH